MKACGEVFPNLISFHKILNLVSKQYLEFIRTTAPQVDNASVAFSRNIMKYINRNCIVGYKI